MTTLNGAVSNSSTGSDCLNFFFSVVRNTDEGDLINLLESSWKESPLDTVKLIFHLRDCRGGKGERLQFYRSMKWLLENHPNAVFYNIDLIPFFGCWTDLIKIFSDPEFEPKMIDYYGTFMKHELNSEKPPTLAAKWAPSSKTELGKRFAKHMKMKNEDYRKMLTTLRKRIDILETKLTESRFEEIDYSNVPSVAMMRYRKLFQKKDSQRFQDYIEMVKNRKVQMKVGRLMPHQILENQEDTEWAEYVRQLKEKGVSFQNAIPVIDVSGSMSTRYNGIQVINVAIAMGMLISELNSGVFHNKWITFSTSPKMETFLGSTMTQKLYSMNRDNWSQTTDLQRVFDLILDYAKFFDIEGEKLPKTIFIFSDMQFNEACPGNDLTNLEVIKSKFDKAGYKMPRLIFWNLCGKGNDYPAKGEDKFISLVSGWSSDLLECLLSGEDFTPIATMRKVLDSERYASLRC